MSKRTINGLRLAAIVGFGLAFIQVWNPTYLSLTPAVTVGAIIVAALGSVLSLVLDFGFKRAPFFALTIAGITSLVLALGVLEVPLVFGGRVVLFPGILIIGAGGFFVAAHGVMKTQYLKARPVILSTGAIFVALVLLPGYLFPNERGAQDELNQTFAEQTQELAALVRSFGQGEQQEAEEEVQKILDDDRLSEDEKQAELEALIQHIADLEAQLVRYRESQEQNRQLAEDVVFPRFLDRSDNIFQRKIDATFAWYPRLQ